MGEKRLKHRRMHTVDVQDCSSAGEFELRETAWGFMWRDDFGELLLLLFGHPFAD